MAIQRHLRKVGAHSNQETQPCDTPLSRPTVAPDSQPPPPTARKRKRRTLSPQQQDSQPRQHTHPSKRQKKSESSRDPAKRPFRDKPTRLGPTALKELNRRNALLAKETPPEVCKVGNQVGPETVEQLALKGGPDLSDLRQVRNLPIPSVISDKPPVSGSFRLNACKKWEIVKFTWDGTDPEVVGLPTRICSLSYRRRHCSSQPQTPRCKSSGMERGANTTQAIPLAFSHVRRTLPSLCGRR